jgi:hypothetical protein
MADEQTTTTDTTTTDTTTTATKQPRTVPEERFSAMVQARDQARGEVATLQEELAQWKTKAATVDTIAAQLAEAKAATEQTGARFGAFRAAAALGVTDPEVFDAIVDHYDKLPATGRPKLDVMLNEWKKEITEPAADRATAPKIPRLIGLALAEVWKPTTTTTQTTTTRAAGHAGHPFQGPAGTGTATAAAIYDATAKLQRGEMTREDYDKIVGSRRPAGGR